MARGGDVVLIAPQIDTGAQAVVQASGGDTLLVGRAECYLVGRPDLDETLARLRAYADAPCSAYERLEPALVLFDCAVNQGVVRAKSILYTVATSSQPFVVAFQAERALAYARLPTFDRYGRGWMRRLLRTTIEASAP